MADIYCIIPHFLAYKGLNWSKTKIITVAILLKNARYLTYMMGIKDNVIKHCFRADKRNMLFEPNLKVLFIKFGWGATLKNQRMKVKCRK